MTPDLNPPSPVSPAVDFDADGKQHGALRLPWSRDDSAWGAIHIPICVVRNGDGPTALFFGGNHGDEYEGPIALYDLARLLKPVDITGRVIIVPALNYPAFRAAKRTSPIDGGNMNRIFPGSPDGGITEKIADFVTRGLLPLADVVLDIHSGGKTLDFVPFAAAHFLADKEQQARCMAAAEAFGAPFAVRMREIDAAGMLDTSAEALGKTFVTTELAGGGTATPETAAIARHGVRNLLKHAGILDDAPERQETRWLTMEEAGTFAASPADGLVDYALALGDEVRRGEPVARIIPHGSTGAAPVTVTAPGDGLLIGRHFPGLVQTGDCVAVVGSLDD